MKAWGALGTILNVASILFGGTAAKRQVILSCETEKIILPVTPREYEVATKQENKTVNVEQVGEALVFGLPGAQQISFSSFFPALVHDYPFVVGDEQEPAYFVEKLKKWKESRKPVRIIITDSPVNLMTGIMEFNYREDDGSRDIYFSLKLTEYKDLNTPLANNNKQIDDVTGLKDRPGPSADTSAAEKMNRNADVVDVARRAYGDVNKWRRIVKSNDLKDLAINNVDKLRGLVIK